LPVERYEPPHEIMEDAKRIMAAAGIDVGGVEYLVDARDGERTSTTLTLLSISSQMRLTSWVRPFVELVDLILDAPPQRRREGAIIAPSQLVTAPASCGSPGAPSIHSYREAAVPITRETRTAPYRRGFRPAAVTAGTSARVSASRATRRFRTPRPFSRARSLERRRVRVQRGRKLDVARVVHRMS
jgi:hypothetical protein